MNLRLKAKIIEKYGTQADFAQEIDTDETIISRVVRGRRKLDSNKKYVWAKALRCQLKEIFIDEDESPKQNRS